jgi:hypothetical protein
MAKRPTTNQTNNSWSVYTSPLKQKFVGHHRQRAGCSRVFSILLAELAVIAVFNYIPLH